MLDDGSRRVRYPLNRSHQALLVPNLIWRARALGGSTPGKGVGKWRRGAGLDAAMRATHWSRG